MADVQPEDIFARHVTIAVAADMLGVDPRTMRDLTNRGLVPFRQFPRGRRMVDLADIERILRNQHESHPPVAWREGRPSPKSRGGRRKQ